MGKICKKFKKQHVAYVVDNATNLCPSRSANKEQHLSGCDYGN
jgi:hypothetical protein